MLVLIVNPTAGGTLAKQTIEALRAPLDASGEAYEVQYTNAPGHATELARAAAAREDCEAVITVGGDGTAYEVAVGLMGTGKPMGIIASGTGNDFIRSLDYPKRPEEALARILKREAHAVDMISINDRCCLNVSGTGFDVTVLKETERYHGRFHGMVPYLLGLLRGIALYKPVHVSL